MITALDTSVALDILLSGSEFAARSLGALRQARQDGQLVICELVVAEITPVLPRAGEMAGLLADWSVRYVPCGEKTALVAGQLFRTYLRRGGKRGRVVADFLIGAHAQFHADRLLTRDEGFQRRAFPDLKIWYP